MAKNDSAASNNPSSGASKASRYISWTSSSLIVLVALSYFVFGYLTNERVKIAGERSQLFQLYEEKSLMGSAIFSYLSDQDGDISDLEQSVFDLTQSIEVSLELRPEILVDVPEFNNVAAGFVVASESLKGALTAEDHREIVSEIILLNNRLNEAVFKVNESINKQLAGLSRYFFFSLALAGFAFLLLAYFLTLMRTTISKISSFTSQIIQKLSTGSIIDMPAKETIAQSKLLPGADLLVGETVKLAEMYRGAIVTERRLFQEQKTLSDKFEATNIELIAAKEETYRTAQLSAIGKVAGSVSHEINNPITGILGYIAYVRKKSTDPELVKYLEKAQKEVERIGRIAKSLLVFSRHNVAMPSSKFDLASSVENVAVLAGPQLHDSLVEIDVAPMGDLPSVVGRVDEFQQCLLNMVLNARDALKKCEERKIWITARVSGENIELLITDSGLGVPKDFREHLFQPFRTTKPAGEGSGLGLSVCRELMARMGGTAEFDPTYGPGARFILSLPIFTEVAPTTAPVSQ